MWDVKRQVMERFTSDPTKNVMPAWSPDGKHLAFTSGLSGVPNMFVQATDGSGAAEQLRKEPTAESGLSLSRPTAA